MKPLALDLFCCAGGASRGLADAGFEVVGVDRQRQPRYPFAFVQADALRPPFDLSRFDFIWASPPCQAHTAMKTMHNAKEHLDLIPPTRAMLCAAGVPWVMENVVGAPLDHPFTLCGTMFGLGVEDAELRRHRLFEASFLILTPDCRHGARDTIGVYGGHVRNRRRARTIGVYGEGVRDSRRKFDKGVPDFSIDQGRAAMGIDWMTTAELSQAIPPAYSEFIGRAALAHLGRLDDGASRHTQRQPSHGRSQESSKPDVEAIERAALAVHAARYRHPTHPRAPIAPNADDMEYARRLARAAIDAAIRPSPSRDEIARTIRQWFVENETCGEDADEFHLAWIDCGPVDLREIASAILVLRPASSGGAWQGMESAPLDCTEVLLATLDGDVCLANYEPRAIPPYWSTDIYDLSDERHEVKPIAWQPRPAPPVRA